MRIAIESTPLSRKSSIHAHKSSGLSESILVKGLRGLLDPSKITFLCRLPPSVSVEVVYSYAKNVVKFPGSLCSSAALAISAHADLWTLKSNDFKAS